MKKQKGITIIALIITIILMLILATVSVNVAINGGLFEKSRDAVSSTEIASEKETVTQANILAKSKSKIVTVEDVQKALNSITDENSATAMDNGETIVVKFNKNDRYYEIENSGKVQGPIELVKDDYAGDLSKGGACDGSAEKPFKITCIEDLVAFSIMVNGGDSELGIEKNRFQNKYVELTKSLDFKSIFSYNDYKTTKYDKFLGGDGTTELKTQLSQEGKGFVPIGKANGNFFQGIFEGNGYEIKNLYENTSGIYAGLFGMVFSATIQNINVEGNIISNSNTGGVVGSTQGTVVIKNCSSDVKINTSGTVGGLVGFVDGNLNIINCFNYGDIGGSGTGKGGICGYSNGNRIIKIINCGNSGNIDQGDMPGHSYASAGGIYGTENLAANIYIYNCYNVGKIKGYINAGGIIGTSYNGSINVYNCYNAGKLTAKTSTGSLSGKWKETINANKFYYLSDYETNDPVDENCIELEKGIMQSQSFINDYLNKNVEEYNLANKENEDFVELKTWKMNTELGYPTCE